jgi:hypothetical protein
MFGASRKVFLNNFLQDSRKARKEREKDDFFFALFAGFA